MRLKAAFEGKLQEYLKAEFATAERAVTLGVREATDGLKLSMRRQVTSAGLGQRMVNTWRGDLYPRGQNSIRAAGMVYTKASRIMEGFESAAVIRSKDGWWLAIPTPNAPKRGIGAKLLAVVDLITRTLCVKKEVKRRSGMQYIRELFA